MTNKCYLLCLCFICTVSVFSRSNELKLNSTAFRHHGNIPKMYSRLGNNISPPLAWSGEPDRTKSFMLIMMDFDAKRKKEVCLYDCVYDKKNPKCPVIHWVLYNIPKTNHDIKAGIKAFTTGLNSYHQKAYIGMNPPKGEKHRYTFYLYALDIPIVHIPSSSNAHDLLYATRHNVIAKTSLIGRYQKRPYDSSSNSITTIHSLLIPPGSFLKAPICQIEATNTKKL